MTYGVVFLAILSAAGVARIVMLNSEIKTLIVATEKFRAIAQTETAQESGMEQPVEVLEAQTEYEWLKNTTDLKKEARTIWIAGTAILLIVLGVVLIF